MSHKVQMSLSRLYLLSTNELQRPLLLIALYERLTWYEQSCVSRVDKRSPLRKIFEEFS